MPLNRAFPSVGLLAALALCGPTDGAASTDPSNLCLTAAAEAAAITGVPYEVLLAVSVVETGRDDQPWPWTVNLGGEGHWLETLAEAEGLVESAIAEGLTNIDLGCFQLNYRWHAQAFTSTADMLDPARNAAYAAGYLAQQFAETGDWSAAAAAYHSATPEHAERYQARFDTAWAALGDGPALPATAEAEAPLNRFPLLVAGKSGQGGSLVPATSGGSRLIGGP